MGRSLVIIRRSAHKHGITDDDIRAALATPLLSGPLDDDHPQRKLVLGFDSQARVLDLVVLHGAVAKWTESLDEGGVNSGRPQPVE